MPVDSFITVFILCNVGQENKLIRAPLLGLAKSIYYIQYGQKQLLEWLLSAINAPHYYTITVFNHIRLIERAKFATVLHYTQG